METMSADCYACHWLGIDCSVDEEDRFKPCPAFMPEEEMEVIYDAEMSKVQC